MKIEKLIFFKKLLKKQLILSKVFLIKFYN